MINETAGELLKLQTSVEETNIDNKNLVSVETIDGTPLAVVGNDEEGYFIAMGQYKMTEIQKTKEEALENLKYNEWNIILRMMSAVIEINEKMKTTPFATKEGRTMGTKNEITDF